MASHAKAGTVIISEAWPRWWALIAIAASVLVDGLDLTVLNLALPTLARDLHASTSDLQWLASGYSTVHLADGASHWPQRDQPDVVARLIKGDIS